MNLNIPPHRKREIRKLLVYSVVTIVSGLGVFWMLNGAWEPGSISHDYVWESVNYFDQDVYAGTMTLVGFFLGLLLSLLFLDKFKKIPSIILLTTGIGSGILLLSVGTWDDRGRVIANLFPFFPVGVLVGFVPALPGAGKRELRWSSRVLFFSAALIVSLGFIDRHYILDTGALSLSAATDLVFSLVFLISLFSLIKYDDLVQVAILGPKKDRKSLLFGLYDKTIEDEKFNEVEPWWHNEYSKFRRDAGTYFNDETMTDQKDTGYNYKNFFLSFRRSGAIPYNARIQASDYKEGLFPDIIEKINDRARETPRLSQLVSLYSRTNESNEQYEDRAGREEAVNKLSEEVHRSDVLLLLLPMDGLMNGIYAEADNGVPDDLWETIESTDEDTSEAEDYLSYYDEVISSYQNGSFISKYMRKKEVVIVLTRSRPLGELYKHECRKIPHDMSNYDTAEEGQNFMEYAEDKLWVNTGIPDNHENILNGNSIYPFYYQGKEEGIDTVGAERILKKISG